MTGTDLKIVTPAATEILGPEVDRLATLHTNARTDRELLAVWIKSHADCSSHTVRAYARIGDRFLRALAATRKRFAPGDRGGRADRTRGHARQGGWLRGPPGNGQHIRGRLRAAKTVRDRLLLEVAYYGGLRVSELVSLTGTQVIQRDNGEAQLALVGKATKSARC